MIADIVFETLELLLTLLLFDLFLGVEEELFTFSILRKYYILLLFTRKKKKESLYTYIF